MEKRVLLKDAERRNPAINRLANREAAMSKAPKIPRCGDRKVRAASLKNFQALKFAQNALKNCFVSIPLQDFAKNQVRESQPLLAKFAV